MVMSDFFMPFYAFSTGIVLGAIFFGGLWWTLQISLSSRYAGFWLLISLLLRSSICLTVFYFIGRDHPERFLICLVGFIAARMIILRLTEPTIISPAFDAERNDNAD